MGAYSSLYLVHLIIFIILTITMFSITLTLEPGMCPDDLEGEEGGTDDIMSMLMISQYLYISCSSFALLIYTLSRYYSSSFLPGERCSCYLHRFHHTLPMKL